MIILPFTRTVVRIERERDGEGWLVLTPNGHGWLHGDLNTAIADAREIAEAEFGVGSSAGGGNR